jgi:hypothetical protein
MAGSYTHKYLTCSYSTFVDLSTGLARTWRFNRMRHRNVEFNPALLGLLFDIDGEF